VLDTVKAPDCSISPANWLFTYNSGKYIEGLSVLAAVTGDSQWTNLCVLPFSIVFPQSMPPIRGRMINILIAAVKNNVWQGSDGIITEGSSPDSNNDGVGFKGQSASFSSYEYI
jgi:hypothetical protein